MTLPRSGSEMLSEREKVSFILAWDRSTTTDVMLLRPGLNLCYVVNNKSTVKGSLCIYCGSPRAERSQGELPGSSSLGAELQSCLQADAGGQPKRCGAGRQAQDGWLVL